MPSLEEITTRCERIGAELREDALSRYDIIDRATALGLCGGMVHRLVDREGLGANDAGCVCSHVDTLRARLHEVSTVACTAEEAALREMVVYAQRDLLAACRVLERASA